VRRVLVSKAIQRQRRSFTTNAFRASGIATVLADARARQGGVRVDRAFSAIQQFAQMQIWRRNSMPFSVMLLFGTRPEAIKMALLARHLSAIPAIDLKICVTGQHREMLDQVLATFGICADENLAVMQPAQTINQLTANLVTSLDALYARHEPDLVLVHGDTTTCFAASLTAFHRGIAIGHVEAGLRTGNLQAPWPEEANRRLTAVLAELHFAPTPGARENLLRENADPEAIHVTGNTVIDALLWMRDELRTTGWQPEPGSSLLALRGGRMVLVTGHRRESFGGGLDAICRALRRLADDYPDVDFVYPVHLNPGVKKAVHGLLDGISNVHLIEPLDYQHFVWAMVRCHLILTDSGGIQEEAPILGKPVLVMRETTERPEALACGALRLVGLTEQGIVDQANLLLDDDEVYRRMSEAGNPFGDGRASERIAGHVVEWLERRERSAA
jgi:UDP-N-acetylglucosamine 2-epimerase (non-hydrolysing)